MSKAVLQTISHIVGFLHTVDVYFNVHILCTITIDNTTSTVVVLSID